MQLTSGIPATELQARREKFREYLNREKLRGYVLFGRHYIQYFTGFGFPATERPVALVGNALGEPAIFAPEFEVERVRAEIAFERVESYHTPIEPGMVFTIEPGVYANHIGGFRHSAPVAVTADRVDILTHYPRDLDSLIIPM